MPKPNDLIFSGPQNLYKDYQLIEYIVTKVRHARERGRYYDSLPSNQGYFTKAGGYAVTNVALATIKSPFLFIYHAFTPTEELMRLTDLEETDIMIAKIMRSSYE